MKAAHFLPKLVLTMKIVSLKYGLLILLLQTAVVVLHGQSYNFTPFGISDGLAHDRVIDVCEDKFGNLWIATGGGGLSKFNGINFKNYTIQNGLLSNYVRSVICDNKGNIWAATAAGISLLDGRSIKNFVLDSANENNNSVNEIFESKTGDIWFSMPEGGLGHIDSTLTLTIVEMPQELKNDKVIALEEDYLGRLWVITAINGLYCYDQGKFTSKLKNVDFKGYLLSIKADDQDNFWIGTNRGLIKYCIKQEVLIDNRYTALNNTFVKGVEIIDTAQIWVFSASGAMQYHQNNGRWFGAKEGLTDKSINIIFKDREGTIWFGSDGDGLFKLSNQLFAFYDKQHGLSSIPVSAITKNKNGHYWFGSMGNPIQLLAEGKFKTIDGDIKLETTYTSALAADSSGNIWIGTRSNGLIKFDGHKYTKYTTGNGLVSNLIRLLHVDTQNHLFIGTVNGLSVFDGQRFHNYNIENGLSDNVVWKIINLPQNEMLIITRKGFHKYNNKGLELLPIKSSVFEKRINTALYDSLGNYWIGYSGHGVLKLDANGIETFFTVDDGLTSDLIYNLLFDAQGNILVGSERGIDKLILDDSKNVIRIKNYGKTEGFSNLQTAYNVTLQEPDGALWFGTDKGVFYYNPQDERINQKEPLTYISGIKLFYQEVDWTQYTSEVNPWLNVPKSLSLSHNDNNLLIQYLGSSKLNPQDVKYKFRLIGLEEAWSPVTSKTEAMYTNLAPGEYTFEVMASNSDFVWTREPVRFNFEIIPPFWMRWWFYLIVAVGFLGTVKFYNDHRIKSNLSKILAIEKIRIEEQEKVRKKMARDFHDNMGNQLASITVFVNLINLKLKDKSKEIDDLLSNIQRHTNSLFSGTKDFIWSMDPDSDNLAEVYTYIKDFGEELFEKTEITFYAQTDDLDELAHHLPSGSSRHLVLIFKEAMTNALKHAQATQIHLSLALTRNEFILSLVDNGIGISAEVTKHSMGIKNMYSRAKHLFGEFGIENAEPKGTRVFIRAQLNSKKEIIKRAKS